MNAPQLEIQLKGTIRHALESKQIGPDSVISVLEMIKLDLFCNMREAMKSNLVLPHPRMVPPNGQ